MDGVKRELWALIEGRGSLRYKKEDVRGTDKVMKKDIYIIAP